jgi:hypothetical protein
MYLIKIPQMETYLSEWQPHFTHWSKLRSEAMRFHKDNLQQAESIAHDHGAVVVCTHEALDGVL